MHHDQETNTVIFDTRQEVQVVHSAAAGYAIEHVKNLPIDPEVPVTKAQRRAVLARDLSRSIVPGQCELAVTLPDAKRLTAILSPSAAAILKSQEKRRLANRIVVRRGFTGHDSATRWDDLNPSRREPFRVSAKTKVRRDLNRLINASA